MLSRDFNNTVSDIVRADYRTADVFKKHGINYCCSGHVSLQDACALRQLDYDHMLAELEEASRTIFISNFLAFNTWKIDFLTDYIINVHHAYLIQAIPALEQLLTSFMKGHQKKYPELVKIHEAFMELSTIIQIHNLHEEEVIFPYIKQIEIAYRRKETYGNLFVRTLRKPLSDIEKEHNKMSDLLDNLKMMTSNYTFPANACTNHQVLYHKLKEFHEDMVQHKHLENNILFPKAIEIEQQLLRL